MPKKKNSRARRKANRNKQLKVIDVSKLRAPTNITFEIEVGDQTFVSVFEIGPDTTKEEIDGARANLTKMLEKQVEEAHRQVPKWLRFKVWFVSLFK